MIPFIAYQLPNEDIQVKLGAWRKALEPESGDFIISDANGNNFWVFDASTTSNLDELSLFSSSDCTLNFISKENYLENASRLIQVMKEDKVEKVVYSRLKEIALESSDLRSVFKNLCARYPQNFNYFFWNEDKGLWMGSTPEILLKGENSSFFTMALAGTLPADASDEDWTYKEYEEQQYVADYIQNLIDNFGQLEEKSERYVYSAGPVKHLRNDFKFKMNSDVFWDFVRAMHPTPAVCGVPKQESKQLYEKFELHQRSLYTGIIGVSNAERNLLFVNLRCMQIFKDKAALYVGGGFTQDSQPEKEWQETERKAKTLADVVQNSDSKSA